MVHCFKHYLTPTLAVLTLCQACIVFPKVDESAEPICDLVTRQLTLDMASANLDNVSCEEEACAVVLIAPFVVSSLVSGSVYIVGNTVHWLEEQGRCDESLVRQTLSRMKGALRSNASR